MRKRYKIPIIVIVIFVIGHVIFSLMTGNLLGFLMFFSSGIDTRFDNDKLEYSVNDAIMYCESGGRLCFQTMPAWLKNCGKSAWKDIPSCHDGRIEQLIENPVEMSGECKVLHEKLKKTGQYDTGTPTGISDEWEKLMNNMDELGCP